MLFLMGIQATFFLYNAWVIPLRFAFHVYQSNNNFWIWAACDYFADLVYVVDTLFVRTRLMFLDE